MGSESDTEFSMVVRIENFPNLREQISEVETHFGMKWYTVTKRDRYHWAITLFCVPVSNNQKCRNHSFRWNALLEEPVIFELAVGRVVKCAPGGVQDTSTALNFEHTVQNLMIGNVVTVALTVQFFSSVAPPNFDFSVQNDELRSDVVLLVDDREFHVNKSLLSVFSTVFSTMFSEKFKESTCSRIPLEDVDADDFQQLLEVLYHKTDVTSENVRNLLELVNYFDFKDVKNKCEQFLINCSNEEVPLKERLLLADQYLLQELMKSCMEKIRSVSHLQDVTPADVNVLNPKTISQLLQRVVDLRKA